MKLLAILAIVGALVTAGGVAASEANAYSNTDAWLSCNDMDGFMFELPVNGSARVSLFYFSVDGGPWQTTSWYYTNGFDQQMLTNAGWQKIGVGGAFFPKYHFTDSLYHKVVAWEYRAHSDSNGWHYLGDCVTSTYTWGSGGIVFP